MNFHWMHRSSFDSKKDLIELSKKLDSVGYYSLLLTYHSELPDMILKSFEAASNNQKIKYMAAIRTYAISPEYLSMICKSYNDSFPNKLILNIVSGDIKEKENSINNLVFISKDMDTSKKRFKYTEEWMSKFRQLSLDGYYPEIVMGGHSEETKKLCRTYNIANLSAGSAYKDYILSSTYIPSSKQMVEFSVVIRDSKEEAAKIVKGGHIWSIFGTKDEVKKEIKSFYNIGVTDIMISAENDDEKINLVHDLIKELILEEKI